MSPKNETDMTPESIHNEMDALSLQLLTLSQELVTKKLELETWTKQGYLTMAQARNAMGGPHSVSQMQYPTTDIEATVTTDSEECVRTPSETTGSVRFTHFTMTTHKEAQKEEQGLRQRKAKVEDLTSEFANVSVEEKKDVQALVDPIKWFGFLVPNSLKQSQKSFSKAIELSVECANVQNEINGVVARRKFLSRKLAKNSKF